MKKNETRHSKVLVEKSVKRSFTSVQDDRQSGRSMIEMLGVLAIIGVLSVGGVVGYTVAMRKYRANEIAHAISVLAVTAETTPFATTGQEDVDYTKLVKDANVAPYGVVSLTASITNGHFDKEIKLKVDDKNLCLAVKNTFGTSNDNIMRVSSSDCEEDLTLTIKKK